MNRYIKLQNSSLTRAFTVLKEQWRPKVYKPSSFRLTISGAMDTTFANIDVYEFEGIIVAANNPLAYYGSSTINGVTWGTPANLMAILDTKSTITLTDHFNIQYTIFSNVYEYMSNTADWDSDNAVFYFQVKLIGKKV